MPFTDANDETHANPGDQHRHAGLTYGDPGDGDRRGGLANVASDGLGPTRAHPTQLWHVDTLPTSQCDTSGPPTNLRWPISFRTDVLSVNARTLGVLRSGTLKVRRLARFGRAINLAFDRGPGLGEDVVALVTPDIGNGPFHVVLRQLPPEQPEAPSSSGTDWLRVTPTELRLGPWSLSLTPLTGVWDPQPKWERLHIAESAFIRLRSLIGAERARASSQPGCAMVWRTESPLRQMAAGFRRLRSSPSDGMQMIQDAAAQLAGLGIGLTPTGDDELAGAMLALWASHHPDHVALCRTILQVAAPRTTLLSRAFLRAASQGLADQRWHRLMAALGGSPSYGLERAVRDVLAVGATSGLDMLGGFTICYEAIARQ